MILNSVSGIVGEGQSILTKKHPQEQILQLIQLALDQVHAGDHASAQRSLSAAVEAAEKIADVLTHSCAFIDVARIQAHQDLKSPLKKSLQTPETALGTSESNLAKVIELCRIVTSYYILLRNPETVNAKISHVMKAIASMSQPSETAPAITVPSYGCDQIEQSLAPDQAARDALEITRSIGDERWWTDILAEVAHWFAKAERK